MLFVNLPWNQLRLVSMNFKVLAIASVMLGLGSGAPAQQIEGAASNAKRTQAVEMKPEATTTVQELDGSDLRKELREREERVIRLPTEDRLKLQAAEKKALEDPVVKAALERRNKAISEFQATVRAAIIRADPALGSILEKAAIDKH